MGLPLGRPIACNQSLISMMSSELAAKMATTTIAITIMTMREGFMSHQILSAPTDSVSYDAFHITIPVR